MQKNQQKMNRPPIVVVLGHIDHGKTTLLDYLRKTRVAEKEAGGITQSIGASVIEHNGRYITFIDTPGHEAFSAMRARGAKVADLAVLVIAADEGVKPQTEEALSRILEAKLPFLVVLNKTDKPEANAERVKTQLSEREVFVEGWGGNVPVAEISAKAGQGINQFLDLLLLLADLEERPYEPNASASGFVLESHHDPRRGVTATLIVTSGTLRRGDAIIAGKVLGKAKILEDFHRRSVTEVAASDPALVVGWEALPEVGLEFQAGSERVALVELKTEAISSQPQLTMQPIREEVLTFVIAKAASVGALEALRDSIGKIIIAEKKPFILEAGIGEVTESDVKRADAAQAMIVAFGVETRPEARRLAEVSGITIMSDQVIYRLLENFEKEMRHRAEIIREPSGEARLIAFFRDIPEGKIFGARMLRGKISKGKALAFRGPRELGEIEILNLKEGKQDVEFVEGEGKEFGSLLFGEIKVEIGDVLKQFS